MDDLAVEIKDIYEPEHLAEGDLLSHRIARSVNAVVDLNVIPILSGGAAFPGRPASAPGGRDSAGIHDTATRAWYESCSPAASLDSAAFDSHCPNFCPWAGLLLRPQGSIADSCFISRSGAFDVHDHLVVESAARPATAAQAVAERRAPRA